MSTITRSWYSLDVPSSPSGDDTISVHSVDGDYKGRLTRYENVALATSGHSATLTVQQTGIGAFITYDHIEDTNGNTVVEIGSANNLDYFIIGTSNCPLLSIEETSSTNCTTINDPTGKPQGSGFTLIDSSNTSHSDIALDTNISPDYGATSQYTFKIPFAAVGNDGASRTITISIYNTSLSVSASISITQAGQAENT